MDKCEMEIKSGVKTRHAPCDWLKLQKSMLPGTVRQLVFEHLLTTICFYHPSRPN